MELGVLGPLQVRQDGAPVVIPGAKPRAILTMLGLHGGSVVSADTLVELLWGEDPPRTAAKALQTHVSLLRRTLGDGFVLTEGAGWTLAETEVDASHYKAAARRGRTAAAAGDTSQAVARFEEALTLWRGIPEVPDSRRGTSEKTRWIEGHAALVEDRADALLATGRAAEVIGDLEAAVAEAPLRERRWGQLMLALYRAGRQGEALGAYQRARSMLADELGVDPGPELRRLEAAVVAQDTSLDIVVAQDLPSVTRAVTFLLTDIEGSTAAWEADADAMALALARHDELVEQVVTSRGGRLIKTRGEGDATFSVFERPSAGAAAALELQDAISHEPWTLREPMRIRVALHTGEVELRDGDYFGRAVNRAARLRSLAEGGQILCSGATAELVIDSLSDDVMLMDLGMHKLRNLPRPERVFELRLEIDEAPKPQPSAVPIERPALPPVLIGHGPFVGREDELERLLAAWQTTLTGGVHAVLIAGEPGVGKTRLAGEWSQRAYEQEAIVLYGRCDEDLGAPYQPFAEALRSLVPCIGVDRLRGLRGAEALLPLVPRLTDVLPDLASPTRADPDTERYALFDAVVALLEIASACAPVVLILDDLHWAAKPTLLLLRHLLRFGDRSRVQIVGTYRNTDLDRSHPLAAMLADLHRDGTANRLNLSGLDEDDVTAYVAEAGYDDEELAHALASVTGGNPFFLIEALRHVDESGGVWDQSTLPQGVREAVSRRLSRLPAETNKALAAAAVIGSRFALDLVERVVESDLIDAFDEACKAGIVIEEPGGNYRFNHAIVRQSLLAELASVRRMRLHQRIAVMLENQPGADDELLAELAHHYFECAWAGNAVKAVEYSRRAADQAMARLAYEGAADLYDHALHALEEIDDELPDRDDQVAELLVARCEALLAAGDVASAVRAVAQLQEATVDSARLAAWATCFDGQLSMLIHPERLDEVEVALGAAAQKLAQLDDAAGEAKAHTVRAGCLARLGRIGDCEVALDDALTAARRAREHRRVNAVLAGAPLAALWGPNPVPRAGGRCLDVVRLLRITTDSPAVEATSTRCQAVLEAFRGRAAAARRMIDSARRTVTELGLRHALVEVEQYAGIVELVVDDPAAAEPLLRRAYNGFRRMGLDADTAETAALLGRACLALDRDAEADELCRESERLAGHAQKASTAWRMLRAQLLSRNNDHDAARQIAEAAISLVERTDALVDHGDACLALATVLGAAGDTAGARAAAERAAGLYERKGAAALAEKARRILGECAVPPAPAPPEPRSAEPDTACVRVVRRGEAATDREDWDEFEQLFAPEVFTESRRKITGGFIRDDFSPSEARLLTENGALRIRVVVIAVRGERLALTRLEVATADVSPGAPHDEFLHLFGLDEDGRVSFQVSFDIDDIDAATAELDAAHARLEGPQPNARRLDTACVQAIYRVAAAVERESWDELKPLFAPVVDLENRRNIVGFARTDLPSGEWQDTMKRYLEIGMVRFRPTIVATRGERLALAKIAAGTADVGPGAPQDEMLELLGLDEEGRIALQIYFDIEDLDAAIAELDAAHAGFEEPKPKARRLENAATQATERYLAHFAARDWDTLAQVLADDILIDDRRRVVNAGIRHGRAAEIANLRATANAGFMDITSVVIAARGERLILARAAGRDRGSEDFLSDALGVVEINPHNQIAAIVVFDLDDFDAAIAELDARYLAGEAAAHSRTWTVIVDNYAAFNRRELPLTTPDFASVDRRRGAAFAPGDLMRYLHAGWEVNQTAASHVEVVHRLSDLGAVVTHAADLTSREGFDAEWRSVDLVTVEGDLVKRCELFDEADLDAALARFDELHPQTRRLENAASQANERLLACFSAREWEAFADILAEDITTEDRRRVVNAGVRQDRDAEIKDFRSAADLGVTHATSSTIATRGERLALTRCRYSHSDEDSEAFRADLLGIVEINADDRIEAWVTFDLEDFDAAIAELEARFLAGEAAAYSQTWSVITGGYAALNRHEFPATTPDWVNIDHRGETTFGPGDLIAYLRSGLDLDQDINTYIEAVHRLTDIGAVTTYAAHEASREGFDAEWRGVALLTVEGDLVSRCEVFDETDLDAALARFDELQPQTRRLENAASRVAERLNAHFAARDWDAMAEIMAEDAFDDDRRRVVNSGVRHGRDVVIANVRAVADVGITDVTSKVMATRGGRLALSRDRFSVRDQPPEAFLAEVVSIVEIDADERIVARVAFDPDEIGAAIAELDARYLAGDAAAHSRTWTVITSGHATLNRRELPPTTPDSVSIDHRRATAFAPGELIPYLRAGIDLDQDIRTYIEVVHRLSDLGAVCTHVGHGVSHEGFDAEWRGIDLLTVEGDMVNRCEVFDEADLDAALARFDELRPQERRLENTASQVYDRLNAYFAARDWAALAETMADDMTDDDRRRVANSGIRSGRDAVMASMRTAADLGAQNIAPAAVATRGDRLALCRLRFSGGDQRPEAFHSEALGIVEIDADERLMAHVTFDLEDFDAAIAELDARYLAGDAAAHAQTWSVIAGAYAALNRRELPATTPDWVNIDHRRLATIEAGELTAYIRASWDDSPDFNTHIEAVYRLSNLGAVFSQVIRGISHQGFYAEWRTIDILTIDGDLINRVEVFDEADLDPALAAFDALGQPAPRLENAASRADARWWTCFAARDWTAMAEMLAEEFSVADHRRVLNADLHGRDAQIKSMKAIAEIGSAITSTVIATRGQRLVLTRVCASNSDLRHGEFSAELLSLVGIDANNRIAFGNIFDIDDIDAAFEELDARYLAGEAAPHARTWSVIMQGFASLNRRELPPTTPDWVNIDHRRGTSIAPGEMAELLGAAWNFTSDLSNFVEAVHRLDNLGGVMTHVANETSREGFHAEWRVVSVFTVEGDMVNRCEVFDEADLDAALARFDELHPQTRRLENAASRVANYFQACFPARDWATIAEILADDFSIDDRRRTVNAGIRHGRDAELEDLAAAADVGFTNVTGVVIATRGGRLALVRARYSGRDLRPEAFQNEVLSVVEIDADDRMAAVIVFDLDDFDAAITELDARYLAGEAATHAHTWSVIAGVYAALDQHEFPVTTPDWVNIDHRGESAFGPGELISYLRSGLDLGQDINIHIETVHRLIDFGGVITCAAHETSREGFDAEWRGVTLLTVEGDLVNCCEVFDEADLDAALARFDKLGQPAPRLENAASQALDNFFAHFGAREWGAMAEILADGSFFDDRRRVVNAGIWHGRDVVITNMRASDEVGANMALTVVANRGQQLALVRLCSSNRGLQHGEFGIELLSIVEIDADERIASVVTLDVNDIDAAIAELDARYLAGEAAAHAHMWSVITDAFAALNRHEVPATTPDYVIIDHQLQHTTIEASGLVEYLRASWDLTPDLRMYIETVHRLSDTGAVITLAVHGTSNEGFDADWRIIELLTGEGDLGDRCEIFGEANLDAALARFEELSRPAPRLENAASRIAGRVWTCFAARDWDSLSELFADDIVTDDRRRVVSAGVFRGRDAQIANMRVLTEMGTNITSTVIATRGERLALTRISASSHEEFGGELLSVIEVGADDRATAGVQFDPDDFDGAFAELDARYIAGEAAAHAHTWSVIAGAHAAINRRQLPATTPDWVNIDHRRGAVVAPGDVTAYIRASFDGSTGGIYVETVHRLSNLGAVVTWAGHGTSPEGFEAEWRGINVLTVEGDLVSRSEVFDEADLDAALARFEELHPQAPRLENVASQVNERFLARFAARDWNAIAELLAPDTSTDDRRPLVGVGVRSGMDTVIADWRATADIGVKNITSAVIATRGGRLALIRYRFSGHDQRPEAFRTDVLGVVEIDNTDHRITAGVMFGLADIDAAFAELDARYLAGEAAPHSHTWSVNSRLCAGFNRHELPATTPDWIYIDHRPLVTIEASDLPASIRAAWDLTPEISIYMVAVHRLSDLGAVVTSAVYGSSQEGFDAEWRMIDLFTVEGDLINRCEIFDGKDIDAALARFDELNRSASRLHNAATRVNEHIWACFDTRDWDGMNAILAEDMCHDDRRRMVGAGVLRGRDAQIADMRAIADIGVSRPTVDVIAIRGERLALTRARFSGLDSQQAFLVEVLAVLEINGDEQFAAMVGFDLDDIDAAFEELETRYLAGEAAAHPNTWSVIAGAHAAINHGELAPTTPDWVNIDHRAGIGSGDMVVASIRAAWDLTPDLNVYIEAVHRLTRIGAVVTNVGNGTSHDGLHAEWRMIDIFTVDGDLISRTEIFDEADLDTALDRFEELHRPTRLPENAASQTIDHFRACFVARDWAEMTELLAEDISVDDRRPIVGSGSQRGRHIDIANMRALASIGVTNMTSTVIATRGERLALSRARMSGRDQRPEAFHTEVLDVVEINAANQIAAHIAFEPNDIDAAIAELNARYLAGDAAMYARTWSVITQGYAALNQGELPTSMPDWVDHRPLQRIKASDLPTNIRVTWELIRGLNFYIEAVHRLSNLGTVTTRVARGVSQEGFDAEWREVDLVTVEGDRVKRCEIFDEADLDAALARFDELQPRAPRLENATSRVTERFRAFLAARDWDAMTEMMAEDFCSDDRRRVVNTGIRHGRDVGVEDLRAAVDIVGIMYLTCVVIATRGERLELVSARVVNDERPEAFLFDVLQITEIDADGRIAEVVTLDSDDIDAAFAELDARYLAGEAAAHSHTWSVIARQCAAFNRHELPAADWVTIDHRPLAPIDASDLQAAIRAIWDLTPDLGTHIEAVHRLGSFGAVVTFTACGTSPEGFDAEWRMIDLLTVEGDRINRIELFDEADLDAALARFDELHP